MRKPLLAAVLAALVALSLPSFAQPVPCLIGDDGFNVGCCNVPTPNLPAFPSITSSGKWGCLNFCNLEAESLVNVSFSAPLFVVCDIAIINVTVAPAGPGAPAWTGTLFAKYSRTWIDAPTPIMAPSQRWRFLLNGDIFPGPTPAAAGAPCPYPVSVVPPLSRPLHVAGHIDYICGSQTTAFPWTIRASLHHFEECIQHGPWGGRPLPVGTNPSRTYHLVAPATFSFVPPAPAPAGVVIAESVRSATLTFPPTPTMPLYVCHGEAQVFQGSLNNQFQNCICGPSPTIPGRWTHQNLFGTAFCAGAAIPFSSVPIPGSFIPTGFAALSVGFWPGAFAGLPPENLTAYFGVILYTEICDPMPYPIHIVTGVATSGVPGMLFAPTPAGGFVSSFIDLQNARTITAAGIVPTYGVPFIPTTLWQLNTP